MPDVKRYPLTPPARGSTWRTLRRANHMADKQAPVTITITTHDPEMLAHGAEPVSTLDCIGYMVIANHGDTTQVIAQGGINMGGVADTIIGLGRSRAEMIATRILHMLARKDGPDDD